MGEGGERVGGVGDESESSSDEEVGKVDWIWLWYRRRRIRWEVEP